MSEFFQYWTSNDQTIICALGENKDPVPGFIATSMEQGLLFSCDGVLAGWRHGQKEREHLIELWHNNQASGSDR